MTRMVTWALLAGLGGLIAVPGATSPPDLRGAGAALRGDATRGAQIYENNCTGCHSINQNRVGPSHRGVFGRRAGRATGFEYSDALKNARITWNATTLDRWLTNPQLMVPGTQMGFRLTDAQRRADVIAYLRTQTARR